MRRPEKYSQKPKNSEVDLSGKALLHELKYRFDIGLSTIVENDGSVL